MRLQPWWYVLTPVRAERPMMEQEILGHYNLKV